MTTEPIPGCYLTVKELAARIRKTERWVADRCMPSRPDRLPRHKVGRTNLFSPGDVAAIDRLFAVDQPVEPVGRKFDPALVSKGLRILAQAKTGTPTTQR
jgi:hypothetical protein